MKTAIAVLLALLVAASDTTQAQEAGRTSSSRYSASPVCLWISYVGIFEYRKHCGPAIPEAQLQRLESARQILDDYFSAHDTVVRFCQQFETQNRRNWDEGRLGCDGPQSTQLDKLLDHLTSDAFVLQLPAYLRTRKGPNDGICL